MIGQWGLRLRGAARGVTTPLFYCWRLRGVNVPGRVQPVDGWMLGLVGGKLAWDNLVELPTEAPMNRQRTRRESRALAAGMTGRYQLGRRDRRKIARAMASAAARKAMGAKTA